MTTIITYGFGVKVYVKDGYLHVEGGIGENRHHHKLHRATAGLTRLAVLSADGYVSLDALRWLHHVGASLVVIDFDGEVILAEGPRRDDAGLRKAQILSDDSLKIARFLIAEKVKGQGETAGLDVSAYCVELDHAPDCETILNIEGRAAADYWNTLSGVAVRFACNSTVPEHWLTLGSRLSHITNTARRATTPGHALLNYAYAVLSGETRIALLAMGLDPAQGFLHRDLDALVHDVMEPVRPLVDRWLLALLERQVFTPADFSEDRRGEVRLSYAIRNQVTAHADAFRSAVAPYVEAVAHVLDKDAPTPLTGRKRSRSSRRKSGKKAKWILPVTILERCAMCGEPVQDRLYCERCTPQQQAETLQKWIQAGSRARRTHGGVSGVKRGAANRAHLRANAMDNADALREVYDWSAIFEDIQEIPLRTLASETGLSLRYVSLIRRGLKTPHPRHWPKFAKLVEGNPID